MKKSKLLIETIKLFTLIILYYIVGTKSIFLYVLSLCLYNIFNACFNHITLTNTLKKIGSNKGKQKLYQYVVLLISIISLVFLLLSICISDVVTILLNIDNILLVFVIMGLSIIAEPLVRITAEYIENINNNKRYLVFVKLYHILDNILLIIISLFAFRVFKLEINKSVAILYLSKIISAILVMILLYLTNNKKHINETQLEKINYLKETKRILTKNGYRSLTEIIKYSYYYVSIIVLYVILSTRYSFAIDSIENNISFIYLYAIGLINYLIYFIDELNRNLPDNITVTSKIYNNFKVMLPLIIIFSIISPLTCKIIFNNPNYSIYLTMTNFMGLFILLYELTYEKLINKTILHISLFSGIFTKVLLILPLINSFYRMGYNLVYGDITSTIIGMFISVIINYIYLKKIAIKKENYFDRVLDVLYKNILLCIILILLQFIIPIDTENFFKSFGIMMVYIMVSIAFLSLKKKRRRG